MAVSPRGQWIAANERGHGGVHTYRLDNGDRVASLRLPQDENPKNSRTENSAITVAFSPDGRHVACGGNLSGHAILLWDRASDRISHSFKGHGNLISRIVFTPDGRQLISSSLDETVRLWDVPASLVGSPPDRSFKLLAGSYSDGMVLVREKGGNEYFSDLDFKEKWLKLVDPAEIASARSLQLELGRLTDKSLRSFPEFGKVEHVRVTGERIRGTGLSCFESATRLESLEIHKCPLSLEGFRTIGRLEQLRILDLFDNRYSDEGLAQLAALKNLNQLGVRSFARVLSHGKDDPFSADVFERILPLPRLERLTIRIGPLSPKAVTAVSKQTSLKYLNLRGSQIPSDSIVLLQQLPKLETLGLDSHQELGDADLIGLASIKTLSNLVMGYWTPGEAIEYVRELEQMSLRERVCYGLVRELQSRVRQLEEAEFELARAEVLGGIYVQTRANREERGDARQEIRTILGDLVDVRDLRRNWIPRAAKRVLELSDEIEKRSPSNALSVWKEVYIASGMAHPKLRSSVGDREWRRLQAQRR